MKWWFLFPLSVVEFIKSVGTNCVSFDNIAVVLLAHVIHFIFNLGSGHYIYFYILFNVVVLLVIIHYGRRLSVNGDGGDSRTQLNASCYLLSPLLTPFVPSSNPDTFSFVFDSYRDGDKREAEICLFVLCCFFIGVFSLFFLLNPSYIWTF